MAQKFFRIGLSIFLIAIISNEFINVVFAWRNTEDKAYFITDFESFEDSSGEYSFESISSPGFNNQFTRCSQKVISLGITKSIYWIRFKLPLNDRSAMSASQLLQLNNPNIDKIDVFLPIADNSADSGVRYLVRAVGVSRPSINREIWDNSWVFSIPNQYRDDRFLYLRLESSSALRLPVVLWQENAFITEAFLKNLGFGVFYGILCAMLFF